MSSKRIILILLILLIFVGAYQPVFADHNSHHIDADYVSPWQQTESQFAKYKQEIQDAFNVFREKAAKVWGSETVVPTSRVAVRYRDNFKQRSVVDFEQGVVKVELAIPSTIEGDVQYINQRLAAAVEDAIMQAADDRSIIEMAKNPIAPDNDNPPVLVGLVAGEDGSALSLEGLKTFKYSQARLLDRRPLIGKDGKSRIIVSTQFYLVADHIRILAEKYRETVDMNAHRHKIPSPLVFAIMETESSFNPTAKSPVPAFGLMQLVPKTGARDAFRFLHAKDRVLKDTYLYNTDNNIDLGVAYLHILFFRYLKYIKNPQSKQWAVIAAYNTGVTNVFRSFAGEYDKSKHGSRWSWRRKAVARINKMKPEQVYKHMRKHLPQEETRDYIKKVRERMSKYRT